MWYWYRLFEIEDLEKVIGVDYYMTFTLEGVGNETVRVWKSNNWCILFKNYILPIGLNDRNPYVTNDTGVGAMIDDGAIWAGVYAGNL